MNDLPTVARKSLQLANQRRSGSTTKYRHRTHPAGLIKEGSGVAANVLKIWTSI